MDILLCLQNKIKEINDMNDNRNNYSWSSQCHRRNTRFHFRFGEEWVIRIQSDRANQYVGTDTMCNYHADKIADSKNAKGGGMTQKMAGIKQIPIIGEIKAGLMGKSHITGNKN